MNVPLQTAGPMPLREGTVLDERFAVGSVLGRGGFGITYLAEDLARGDSVVINELAPLGASRDGDDLVFLSMGPAAGQRLRHLFTSEARRLQRFRVPRMPQVRAVFHEHGTAYFATDYIDGAVPLTELVTTVPFEADKARRMFELLLDTLEAVHNHGVVHQDIKPSNILVSPTGDPYLVDFGAARQWHADLTIAHEEQFATGYAPPEQMNERNRRSPSTDLYGLAATIYTLLTATAPPSAVARLEGVPVVPLRSVRPDVDLAFASALEQCLEIDPDDRPQTVAELRALLTRHREDRPKTDRVRDLDAKRRRLQMFRFDRMQCPACGDVLAVPDPLSPDVCPVCQDGKIKKRRIEEKACPSCGAGVVRPISNVAPLRFCPNCTRGRLVAKRRFLRPTGEFACQSCDFSLKQTPSGAVDSAGVERTWDEWRRMSGRQELVMYCDACTAQFDVMPDGRWQRMTQSAIGHDWSRLYPDEWARVAAGLNPDAGNACCESCGADYFIADNCITLLSDPLNDPHGFASHYCGHLVPHAQLPFLAVGKESGRKGLVCRSCRLEFDTAGTELKLVRSGDPRLRRHAGETHKLRDWHRIAQDLPRVGEEDELSEDIALALGEAFANGEVPFDAKHPDLVWRGTASEVHSEHTSGRTQKLTVTTDAITLGSFFKKRSELVRDVVRAEADGDVLNLRLIDNTAWSLRVEPVKLKFKLESGRDEVELGASALARRLSAVSQGRRGKA
jgi:hypothetical protein